MSQRKSMALALALLLSVGLSAQRVALGGAAEVTPPPAALSTPEPDAVEAATEAPAEGDSAAAPDPQTQKRKGNGFVRALSAPFRALARLFGGGKKNEAAKVRQQRPAPSTTAPAAPDTPKAPEPADTAQNAAGPNGAAPLQSVLKEAPAARAAEGVRVVRPAEAGAARPEPGMWVPVIGGIPKDNLSQGRALLEHGYVQESISVLSIAASQVGPELVEANNLLGIAYDRMGWHKQAIEAYQRALTIAPKDPFVLANLGFSLHLADDPQGGLKRLKQASKLAPGTPVIYNNLGIVLARLRKYDDAFKHFAIASNEYDAHLKLAGILEDHRSDAEAAKHYEAALRIQPGTSAVLERLVAVYERAGRPDKAEAARRTLGQPKNPQRTTTGGGGGD